jgi:Icc-related predicted phosphoesterase
VIRVVHFSDWHATSRKLPKADLYVCTGDMLPNTEPPPWGIRWPNAYQEEPFQKDWIEAHVGAYAKLPASKDKLLIIVRGNHDFVDLKPLFRGWPGNVVEFGDEPSQFIHGGFRIGGFRGIPPINDCWADENTERVLAAKCEALGAVDVLVTHCPARDRLDRCDDGRRVGSTAVRAYVDKHRPKAHFFGHIHESAGQTEMDGTLFSNAATTVNVVSIG